MSAELFGYLKRLTKEFEQTKKASFTTSSISKQTGFGRSTVSRYLNEGVREGRIVKVREHPVLFLDREEFEKRFEKLNQQVYSSLQELLQSDKADVLQEIIGASGSLKEQIEQMKTAALYPPNGLPIMFSGPSGSGKTFLAKMMDRYCKSEGLTHSDAPFLALNCAQYYNNPELLSSLLFGHVKGAFTGADQDKRGLIEQADGGVLFLDEVHRLTEEGQEKLFTFMDSGSFSPVGSSGEVKTAHVRLIFATTEAVHTTFLPTFVRRLPVIINIPGFSERSKQEKLALIDCFFLEESRILKRKIEVSGPVIGYLLSNTFDGNIGKLRNIIKYSAGHGYAKVKEGNKKVEVNLPLLPKESLLSLQKDTPSRETEVRRYDFNAPQYLPPVNHTTEVIAKVYSHLIDSFTEEKEHYIAEMIKQTHLLLDELYFKNDLEMGEPTFSSLTYHLRTIFKYLEDNYHFLYDGQKVLSMAYLLYFKEGRSVLERHPLWSSYEPRIMTFIKEHLSEAFWLAKQVLTLLSERLDQKMLVEDLILMSFYFHGDHLSRLKYRLQAVILAHGYSTASSMANVVNRMLKRNIFQAVDMPIDATTADIENWLHEFMERHVTKEGLILLVDMGSLSELAERLESYSHGPLLLIDHVSTPVALAVGEMIQNGQSIINVDQAILAENKIRKQLRFPVANKRKAILTCCYTGMGSAIQIQEILAESLKKANVGLEIIPYDYQKLSQHKLQELPFQLYDVLLIIGTEDPHIEGIPYLSLNHLITGTHIEPFLHILKQHFAIQEEELQKELMFHFSLKKMIASLTILDSDRVLKAVEQVVIQLEKSRGEAIIKDKKLLLYVHLCCMVERILRKEEVDDQEDIDEFRGKHNRLMKQISMAVQELETSYQIEISLLEKRLIADILLNGEK